MENSIFQKIINNSGRSISECKCHLCQNQCKIPCLGTPDDILRIIKAGYIDRLSFSLWAVGKIMNKIPYSIPMLQLTLTDHGCIMFENGLCLLHDRRLKPTEGKLSYHTLLADNYEFEKSLSWLVAREWIDVKNITQVVKVFTLFERSLQSATTEQIKIL